MCVCVFVQKKGNIKKKANLNLQACRVKFFLVFTPPSTELIKFVTWCRTIREDMWELIAPRQPQTSVMAV